MKPGIPEHFALIATEVAGAAEVPLSLRRARLCVSLLDVFADRVFAAAGAGSTASYGCDDVLAFRARLEEECPALGVVFAVGAGTTPLELRAVEVPVAAYPSLSVEEYMVSLYNGNSVPRAMAGGREMHGVLAEAVAWWRGRLAVMDVKVLL